MQSRFRELWINTNTQCFVKHVLSIFTKKYGQILVPKFNGPKIGTGMSKLTYNPRENTWKKVKKLSKFEQHQEILISAFM